VSPSRAQSSRGGSALGRLVRPLSKDAAVVYTLQDDAAVEPATEALCERLLSADERDRLSRLTLPKVRRELLHGRALTRLVLSRHAPLGPTEWCFARGLHGKPEVAGPAPAPRLRFNIAHTAGMLVVGVTLERDLGVDVENTTRAVDDEHLAERFFAPAEAADVLARHGDDRRQRFFDYWTLKEAYIKACGEGLALGLDRFWLDLDRDMPRISFAPELDDDPSAWQFARYRPTPTHALAVAIRRGPRPDVHISVEPIASLAAWLRES
jgi:4'-phosphopantetheinyl transferase